MKGTDGSWMHGFKETQCYGWGRDELEWGEGGSEGGGGEGCLARRRDATRHNTVPCERLDANNGERPHMALPMTACTRCLPGFDVTAIQGSARVELMNATRRNTGALRWIVTITIVGTISIITYGTSKMLMMKFL